MFNIGDLVLHKGTPLSFGHGVILKVSDRSVCPYPRVYAYQIYFINEKYHGFNNSIRKRWLLEQDIKLISEAKRNV